MLEIYPAIGVAPGMILKGERWDQISWTHMTVSAGTGGRDTLGEAVVTYAMLIAL